MRIELNYEFLELSEMNDVKRNYEFLEFLEFLIWDKG